MRLHSLARVLLFAAIFTAVVLIVAALWFTVRGSYRWLAVALLVLSLASITVFILRTRDSLQGGIESMVVTISLGCAESSLSDVRHTAYFYSALSSHLQAKLSAQGFVLGRIAPLEAEELTVHVTGRDSVTLENLPVEPLLPLVVGYSEVRTEMPLLKHSWETTDDGERLLTLSGTGPTVEHLFLVAGTRSVYIGELREGETRVVVLPAEAREAEPLQLMRTDDLVERPLVTRGGGVVDSRSAAGDEGLRRIVSDRLYYLIWHKVLRMLMAHGDGTTLVGLRYGNYPLALGRKETPSAHCELVVYRLQ
ncbi:MAG: hypothetical protein A2Y63_00220 [Candidatus Riflebacteria bacterium RBG_13_59_9]|nr:MAG: hypothetical protein A2Y63_00220 [Candidatus Riflebacteria bacterium RBG_13_59_9]